MDKIRGKQIYADLLPIHPYDVANKEYVDDAISEIASGATIGTLSTNEQRKLAYFHAMGLAMTEKTQHIYEAKYKSSHNVRLSEIWSDNIAFAPDYSSAVIEASANTSITLHQEVILSALPESSGQTFAYISGQTHIRPFVSPFDIPDIATQQPSYGYALRLYRGSDATSGITGSEILPSEGSWVVDYYTGLIHFSKDGADFTPANMGWGSIKATFFQYTGNYGISNNGGSLSYTNNDMVVLTVTGDSALACITGILSTPLSGSSIVVFINGVNVSVGDGNKNSDCYFSKDGGVTAKSLSGLEYGDLIYWNSSISGYGLDSSVDKISFLYISN